MNAIQEARGWARFAVAAWGPLETVKPGDPKTWTIRDTDQLLPGYRVITSFNPVRFAPPSSVPGTPHHFETLVISTQSGYGNSAGTYATEAEARDGHAVIVSRVRTGLELAS